MMLLLALLQIAMVLESTSVGAPTSPEISWMPESPTSGSAFAIYVDLPAGARGGDSTEVIGFLQEWDLSFERMSDGRFVALTAAPVGSRQLELSITLAGAGEPEVHVRTINVSPGRFGADTLRVASQFGQTPDSATRVRIAREREQSARVREVAARTHRLWSQPFLRPRTSRVTSGFGRARIFNGQLRSRHWGVDLDGDNGDTVVVANDGIVELVADHYYAGNVVFVNHGGGLVTAYLHLSQTLVEAGQPISRGDPVGLVGSTGRVTGPHLHWSARLGPVLFNPLTLLDESIAAVAAPRGEQ